jgi:hypothetical protein
MNTIMRGNLQYPSNVNYHHFEYERLKVSSNLRKNLQLHLTWKLTAISSQQNIFQKPRNQASVFHLKYSCLYGYSSGLKKQCSKIPS